jgi:hypothetical protein
VSEPGSSGFGSRILGTFAKSFCRNVEARFEPGGLRYELKIESGQIGNLEPAPIMPAAWEAAAAIAENGADTGRACSVVEREIEEAELRN